MDQKKFKREIQEWYFKIGRKEAEKQMLLAGLGWSLTSKLFSGNYESALNSDNVIRIKKAMGIE